MPLDSLNNLERTHTCGELSIGQAGREVVLMGWVARRRDLGHLIFVDLRGQVRGVNQMAEKILGLTVEIEPGTPCHQAFAQHPHVYKVLMSTCENLTAVNRQELTTRRAEIARRRVEEVLEEVEDGRVVQAREKQRRPEPAVGDEQVRPDVRLGLERFVHPQGVANAVFEAAATRMADRGCPGAQAVDDLLDASGSGDGGVARGERAGPAVVAREPRRDAAELGGKVLVDE